MNLQSFQLKKIAMRKAMLFVIGTDCGIFPYKLPFLIDL